MNYYDTQRRKEKEEENCINVTRTFLTRNFYILFIYSSISDVNFVVLTRNFTTQRRKKKDVHPGLPKENGNAATFATTSP